MKNSSREQKVVSGLRKIGFCGTVDRYQRGVITLDEAEAELHGKKPEIPEVTTINPADFAAELKANGVGRQESWSRWVQRTGLNPGMDAKDWYKIYDGERK
jgi:hypothetical protein